jgi:hypothetical protein
MCVAILCPKEFPDYLDMKACEDANKDGGGVAWYVGKDRVRWKKGITADEIFDMIAAGEVTTPAMIHFRIATVGGTSKELCHPFPINKSASLALEGEAPGALVHNGHWSFWGDKVLQSVLLNHGKLEDGPWSDSRAMAWLVKRYGVKMLDMLSGSQKVAVMEPDGRILMWGSWTTEKQSSGNPIYYSNMWWKNKNGEKWVRRFPDYSDDYVRYGSDYGCGDFAGSNAVDTSVASNCGYPVCPLCGKMRPSDKSRRIESLDCRCTRETLERWCYETPKGWFLRKDYLQWRCEKCKHVFCPCDDEVEKALSEADREWDRVLDKPLLKKTSTKGGIVNTIRTDADAKSLKEWIAGRQASRTASAEEETEEMAISIIA